MTVLILRHSATNTLGELIDVLEQRGVAYRYVDMHALKSGQPVLKPEDLRGLVILGGSMNVDQTKRYPFLTAERAFIADVIGRGLPVFGICLGAQLIARSLGAVVEKNPVKEIGWVPLKLNEEGLRDPVLSALGERNTQFQWHEDTFHLPDGAVPLASSEDCARQAFRLGDNVYGVQFHPEVTPDTIEKWLSESKNLPQKRKRAIWEETQTFYAERHAFSAAVFGRFCDRAFSQG